MITDEMVEKAAKAMWDCHGDGQKNRWDNANDASAAIWRKEARAALTAAVPDIRNHFASIAENFNYGLEGRVPKGWAGCRRLIAAAIRDGKQ